MIRQLSLLVIGILCSISALADDDDDDWDGHHHRHHQHVYEYYPNYQEEIVYVPQPVVEYVPVQPRYYAPPPPVAYYGYDQRSTQGLVGGMVGSVMGYEMGRGDPLAAGMGAAAGAWLGNGGW